MSTDDFQVHNIYRYTRKTKKQNRRCVPDNVCDNTRENGTVNSVENSRDEVAFELDCSPRSDDYAAVSPECHYTDPEGEFTNILHKKCPVITLAQQQLARVLEDTNKMLCVPDAHCCRPIRYLRWCKELLSCENLTTCILVTLMFLFFLSGFLLGAATCGTHYGKFNNPVLNCIDTYFMTDKYFLIEDNFHSIT